MKMRLVTEHTMIFSVMKYINTEGGMDEEQYGKNVDTLEDALGLLMQAKAKDSEEDGCSTGWIIVVELHTEHKQK